MLLGISAAQVPLYMVLVAVMPAGAGERAGLGLAEVLGPGLLGWTGLAVVVAVVANLLLIRALQLSPLSLTTPYLSFTPVATLLTGSLLLRQTPSALGLAGVGVVVLGAFVLNAGSAAEEASASRHPLRALAAQPGSRLALGVAVLFGLGNAIDRRAVLHASELVYAGLLMLLMTGVLALPSRGRRELLASRRSWGWVVLGGVVMCAALLLHLFAFRYLFIAYADAVKRAGGNLVAVMMGAMLFGEADWRRRLGAAAVMSVGVALILIGSP